MTDEERMEGGIDALEATTAELLRGVEELSANLNAAENMQADLKTAQKEIRALAENLKVKASKKTLYWLAGSVLFDILLSLALLLGYLKVDHNSDVNTQQSADINRVQVLISDEVLCPFYTALIDQIEGITPEDLEDLTEKELQTYHNQVAAIERGYKALGECKTEKEE